ncbi:lithostathine-1-like [Gigantopelta aegis]|uniref:lithostathine-1-like n=1 Tax=Gigantopelta aegis TaxID=1735272 RepID=UPI001B88A693|nr:lithostathine-1-like [Gigantopelta aegis]
MHLKGFLLITVCTLASGQLTNPETDDTKCLQCADVDNPTRCISAGWCGKNEVCYTREFVDHLGRQAFSMGCESKSRCQLYMAVRNIIGRRRKEPSSCYECCATSECNSGLCRDVIGEHGSTPLPIACPQSFLHGPNSCYYIANWTESWQKARNICSQLGGDLVSVNDKIEKDFIVGLLKPFEAQRKPAAFWTGGFYVAVQHEWTWVDHTATTYTGWATGQPHTTSYYIAMMNPANNPVYKDWAWATQSPNSAFGFICESPYV